MTTEISVMYGSEMVKEWNNDNFDWPSVDVEYAQEYVSTGFATTKPN